MTFWAGESVSAFGSQITWFALPVVAVLTLHASGGQVGLLKTLFTLPYFVFPLAVGVWLDRRRRRPAMLFANMGRALLVLSIPVAFWFSALSLWQLYVVAVAGGALSVVFDVAIASFLPGMVGRNRLASANSRLQTTGSVAGLTGPGLAGGLASLVGVAFTMIADAVSYLVSFGTILSVRGREKAPDPTVGKNGFLADLKGGLIALFGNPPVRQIALHATIYNGSVQCVEVAFLVYAVTDRGLSAGLYGVVLTVGGLGALLGSVVSAPLARRIGFGPALLTALIFSTDMFFLIPAAPSGVVALTVFASAAFMLVGFGNGIANIVTGTIRQAVTPDALLARVAAGYRTMNFGVIPLGSALAGLLVATLGARTTLIIAPFGLMASALPVLARSVRGIRELPSEPPELPVRS